MEDKRVIKVSPKIPTTLILSTQEGFCIYSDAAGIKKVRVPIKKAIAVTVNEGYFFKTPLEMIAPKTQEIEAQIISKFPKTSLDEKFPKKNSGMPIIIRAPKKPVTIPNKFII